MAGIPPRGSPGGLECRSILRPHDKSPKVSFEPPWHGTLETFDSRRAGDGREPCKEPSVSPDSVKTAVWRVVAVVRIAANRPNPAAPPRFQGLVQRRFICLTAGRAAVLTLTHVTKSGLKRPWRCRDIPNHLLPLVRYGSHARPGSCKQAENRAFPS